MRHTTLGEVGSRVLSNTEAHLLENFLPPLSPRMVSAYMEKEQEKYPGNYWYQHKKRYRILGIVTMVFAIVPICLAVSAISEGEILPAFFLVALGSIPGSISIILQTRKVLAPAKWADMQYHSCAAPPSFVRDTVRRVREIYPDAQFRISELTQNGMFLDPILWFIDPASKGRTRILIPLLIWKDDKIVELA